MLLVLVLALLLLVTKVPGQPLSNKYKTHEEHARASISLHGHGGGGGGAALSLDASGAAIVNTDYIAVFLLGSLVGAKDLGEEGPKSPERDFFQRIVSSKLTWGAHVHHFYMVTGNGEVERRVLARSEVCRNTSTHYTQQLGLPTQMYRCGSHGINVLHLPHCDNTGWGASGPCCRCEGAMKFFLDMRSTTNTHHFPTWFLFADDDYYARLSMLQGLVTHPHVVQNKPYCITSIRDAVKVKAGKETVERMFYANNYDNCTVPCTHRSTWMGFAAFSVEALLLMESEIRTGGLQRTCSLWKVTHDVGLGLFVWMHAIPQIPTCCGSGANNEGDLHEGVYFHKAGQGHDSDNNIMRHDDMFHKIWKMGADERGEDKFNLSSFLHYEFQMGRKVFPPHGIMPGAGFKESLFYRSLVFRDMLASQLNPDLFEKYPNLPARVTDYTPRACTAEMDFHIKWRQEHNWPLRDMKPDDYKGQYKASELDRLNGDRVRNPDIGNEPKMCLEYAEAVANYPVHLIDDLDLMPPLDEVTRQRRHLRTEKGIHENAKLDLDEETRRIVRERWNWGDKK